MIAVDLVARLEGVKQSGSGWMARCPAHEDRTPSLSVADGREGVLVHCFAGCTLQSICAALGIDQKELFHPNGNGNSSSRFEVVAEYDYVGQDSKTIHRVSRTSSKEFPQSHACPTGRDGFTWGMGGDAARCACSPVGRVLYRLPEVIEAVSLDKLIHVVEGEKDVAAIESVYGVATCNSGGAGEWRSEHSEPLRDARVLIVTDLDDVGRKHAKAVAAALDGTAASVKIVQPKKGKDAHDHITAGFGLDDFEPFVDQETSSDDSPVFITLAELLADPELLSPPECVVPRLAYRGRGVCLAGADKSGKSTLLAHAVATLTRGRSFLGQPNVQGQVIWLGLEEHVGDAVRRFSELDADPDRVMLVTLSPKDLLERTRDLLDGWPADLVLVDSLQEYARVTCGSVPDDGDNAGWAGVVRPLVRLARDYGIALVILHHVRRSDGEFRGAGEIAAAVDAMLTLDMPGKTDDPTTRRIRGRGRWAIEPFTVVLRDGRYELAGGEGLSRDALVLLHVEHHPGCSKNQIRKAVGGRGSAVDAIVDQLVIRGAIENRGTSAQSAYFLPSHQTVMEAL